jgi:uncharacterized membrane protein HdeD (DUF308 family)
MEKNKKLFKILGIILLLIGFTFLVFGIIDFFKVAMINESKLPGEPIEKLNIVWPLLATPTLFGGFFLFILGFGKKKEYV